MLISTSILGISIVYIIALFVMTLLRCQNVSSSINNINFSWLHSIKSFLIKGYKNRENNSYWNNNNIICASLCFV